MFKLVAASYAMKWYINTLFLTKLLIIRLFKTLEIIYVYSDYSQYFL